MSDNNPRDVFTELWPRLLAGGVTDPLIAVEQVGYLMLLKRFERTRPDHLGWKPLQAMSDEKLLEHLREQLIPTLREAAGSLAEALEEAQFALDDAEVVRSCMAALDRLDLEEGSLDFYGEVFEVLLDQAQTAVRGGEFRTPPAVARLMAELVEPRAEQTICDPATGSGSLLVQAAQMTGLDPATEPRMYGHDIDPALVRICSLNLFFHGVEGARITQADVLSREFEPERFDVILCAPPFGSVGSRRETNPKLGNAGSRVELLFVELCRRMQRGVGAVLVPESFLFGRSGAFIDVRREWLQHLSLQAVVLLPPAVFESYANVRTAILLTSTQGVTEEVWFCSIGEDEAAGQERLGEELEAAAEAVKSKRDQRPAVGEMAGELGKRMFPASIQEIENRGWSLAPAFYRQAESEPPAEKALQLIREVEQGEAEITAQVERARQLLEQLR